MKDFTIHSHPVSQVQISVSGLKEETSHSIYCFAEDDETDGPVLGSADGRTQIQTQS